MKNESDSVKLTRRLGSNDYVSEIVISKVKSQPASWLKILYKSGFFICPPGAKMPWCHNCVEAMSVATIPALEYGDLFEPAFEHEKNCLRYTNPTELETAIRKALTMEGPEIATMRKNVLRYFDEHLSVDGIVKKINAFVDSNNRELTVAVPFIPTVTGKSIIPRPDF